MSAYLRYKTKICLSLDQIEFVRNLLLQERCLIITQKLWKIIQAKYGFSSKKSFNRRKMCSGLTYRDFQVGYSYDEYDPKIHPGKALIQIKCVYCSVQKIHEARQLYGRTKTCIECCYSCYHKLHQQDEEWRKTQSRLQTESQHRPDVQEKHRQNSKRMWQENRPKLIAAYKARMAKQENRDKVAAGMRRRWLDEEYRNRVNGKGRLKHSGIYDFDIVYDSKLELMFLLWCKDNDIEVKRANIVLQYYDELGTQRDYYPDFILHDQFLIEIKGQRWLDENIFVFNQKCQSAIDFCQANNKEFFVIKDDILPKLYRKKALAYHEAQKQNNSALQRQSA